MEITALPDPFLGKIILFEHSTGEMLLALRPAIDQEGWIEIQRGRPFGQILAAIRKLPESRGYDDSFGFHREIPHQGDVYGGGIALFLDGIFYLDCQSQAYGPLSREQVIRILSCPLVRSVPLNSWQIVSAPDGVGSPFPYYLGTELR